MNNAASLTKLLIVLAIVAMTTGCNTMVASVDSMKYGKLYTMQEVLDEAVNNCEDVTARNRALEWAVIGYGDLEKSRTFMERTSQKYAKTRLMMRSLSQLSSRRVVSTEQMCEKIQVVAEASRHYLATIDQVELIEDGAVVIAAVKY